MQSNQPGSIRLDHKGEAARKWLREHLHSINGTWKCVTLERIGQTPQEFKDGAGKPVKSICQPHYILTYYRTRFRFFGGSEKAVLRFSEDDIQSITFDRSHGATLCGAFHRLHIALLHGRIDINYEPPLSGVTPLANARHSEQLDIAYDLHYKPASP